MSNVSKILKNLKSPKTSFSALYQTYTEKCLAIYEEDIDVSEIPEISPLSALLLEHRNLMGELLKTLVSRDFSVLEIECDLSLYEFTYENKEHLILSYQKINADPELKKTYLENGADIRAYAIATAQHWRSELELKKVPPSCCSDDVVCEQV